MIWRRKARSGSTLGASAPAECTWLKADALADETARDVASAAYPGHAPELHEALRDRAAAEVQAAAPLPIDPPSSLADGWALERVAKLQEELSEAQSRTDAARAAHADAVDRLLKLKKPLGPLALASIVTVAAFGTALVIVGIGALLAPSADAYLLRSYLQSVFEADAERFSAVVALYLTTACAAGLLGSQLLAIVITRGRLHGGLKTLFVVADLGFAGAFALMRLGDHFSWQAVAVSVFEFSLSLVCTIFLLGLGWLLKRDAERAEPYSPVAAEVKVRAKLLARAIEAAAEIDARLLAQMQIIETREAAVRRADRYSALATTTADAAYAVTLSKLLAEESRNPSDDALTEKVEAHLATALAREVKQ